MEENSNDGDDTIGRAAKGTRNCKAEGIGIHPL